MAREGVEAGGGEGGAYVICLALPVQCITSPASLISWQVYWNRLSPAGESERARERGGLGEAGSGFVVRR